MIVAQLTSMWYEALEVLMPARLPQLQVTDVGFAAADTLTLQLVFGNAADPSQITGWMLDGTAMSTGPDVLATLDGTVATLAIYKQDDLDGQADPREDGIQIPAGGPHTIRSPRDAAGKSTITISPRPAYRDTLMFELMSALPAFIASYRPPTP